MTVRDIALDVDGDLDIAAGDLVLVSDAAAILQAAKIRMQFFKGEWFLDESAGLPYFQDIFVKNPDMNVLQFLFRKEILATPGITAVNELSLSVDGAARTLSVSYRASSDVGELSATEVI